MIEDGYKFRIGDLVKPNKKALSRNKEFTKDRRFVVTGIDYNIGGFDEDNWYLLAAKNDKSAKYCLQEDEIDLIRKFDWAD